MTIFEGHLPLSYWENSSQRDNLRISKFERSHIQLTALCEMAFTSGILIKIENILHALPSGRDFTQKHTGGPKIWIYSRYIWAYEKR